MQLSMNEAVAVTPVLTPFLYATPVYDTLSVSAAGPFSWPSVALNRAEPEIMMPMSPPVVAVVVAALVGQVLNVTMLLTAVAAGR